MNFKVKTHNAIADTGLTRLKDGNFSVSDSEKDPDAIILRSYKLPVEELNDSLKAVARAGAGYNNVPVEECSEKGIVVFNTPGANANAVKEIVLAGLLMSSRGIYAGANFVNKIDGVDSADLKAHIESGKKDFKGRELKGAMLGVVGMGAIGAQVAGMGVFLDMEVIGYDPAITVEAAWKLPNNVKRTDNLKNILANSDYVTLHVPAVEATRNLIDKATLEACKPGLKLINFARDEIVDSSAVIGALESGQLGAYVTDFADLTLIERAKKFGDVIILPHIGASTKQAEENCSVMAADQLKDYLENGNIKNSVNFPELIEERQSDYRLTLSNKNVAGMIGQITTILAENNINIVEMINKSRDEIAYNVIDLESEPSKKVITDLEALENVINVRAI
ncbi:phosphoglycerate dehydrogenase [SAR86 cluster bacterium]|nr:phosphoglycerate dehydrogenase [SAR86 cluster bacterium]MDC3144926.1 phosphoglycerate dehydrogenase [SAR86 cluster bacterium]